MTTDTYCTLYFDFNFRHSFALLLEKLSPFIPVTPSNPKARLCKIIIRDFGEKVNQNVHAVSKAWTKGGHETYLEIIKINILY